MKGDLMKKEIFKGVGTAIVTPFTDNDVNYEEFGRLLEDQIKAGVSSVIVCGTTGESATMSEDEKKRLIKYAIDKTASRIKVIIGTGSNNTMSAIRMSQYAEEAGADGLLLVTPYYNKTTQEGLFVHYKAIADAVSIPIILYNVPSRTGVNILPETCQRLAQIENIVGIKEASGNISQVAKIASLCGDDLAIYSGNDDQVIPILSLGGKGVISVLSNVMPEYTVEMLDSFWRGDYKKAGKMQTDAIEMIDALFCEVNPIPVKYVLNEMGYDFGVPRLPLVELSAKGKEKVDKAIKKYIKK